MKNDYSLMKKLLIWAMANVLCAVSALAATYPVELNVQLIPPYGNCLADYTATGGAERLIVNALQRDLNHATYDVAVRLTVRQGAHIVMRSSTSSVQPYRLPCGVMTRLSGLSQLFDPRNLEAGTEYADNGFCLPEGAYTLEFQAFDARNRSLPLSEPRYVTAFLGKTPPPRLTLPADGGCVDENSTVITFSWMEAIATPPSPDKRYTLEIFEVPEGYDNSVKDALLTGIQPIYSQTLTGSQTLCSVANRTGLFIKGRTYLWRVRASSVSADENMLYARYENGGFSKVSAFTFKHCVASSFSQMNIAADKPRKTDKKNAPTLLRIETGPGAHAVWKNEPEKYPYGYIVEYNAEGSQAEWSRTYAKSSDSTATLLSAGPGPTYEVHVIGLRGENGSTGDTVFSANSNTLSFKIDEPDALDCNEERPATPTNQELIEPKPMQTFSINGHNVTITEVEKTYGSDSYNGYGFTPMPALGKLGSQVGIKVRFHSLKLNKLGEAVEGFVAAISDPENSNTFSLNSAINETYAGSGFTHQKSITENYKIIEKDGKKILEIYTTPYEYYTGKYEKPYEVRMIEELDPTCKPQENTIDDNVGVVVFSLEEGHPLPFDCDRRPFTSMSISDYYTSYGTAHRYDVPWVGLQKGNLEQIHATFNVGDNTLGAESIRFVCQTEKEQIILPFSRNGNEFTIDIFSGEPGCYFDIFAIAESNTEECKTLTLGRMKLASFHKKEYNLHVVPVKGVKVDKAEIEKKLEEIYGPFGKKFNVEVEEDLCNGIDEKYFEFLNDGLAVEETGFVSRETKEMVRLKMIYDNTRRFKSNDKNAYIFILPKAESEGVTGDMPRCKPVGYIFADGNEDIPSTIAHELGHGLFALEHTFEFAGAEQGATCGLNGKENLMDYCSPHGSFLAVWQWFLLDNHKEYILDFFEDDEDAFEKNKPKCLKIQDQTTLSDMLNNIFNRYDKKDPLAKVIFGRSQELYSSKQNIEIWFSELTELKDFSNALSDNTIYKNDNTKDRGKVLITAILLTAAQQGSKLETVAANSETEGNTVKIGNSLIFDSIYVMAKKVDNKTTLIAKTNELDNLKCGVYKKVVETASIATLMHEFGHLLKDKQVVNNAGKIDLERISIDYREKHGYRCPSILKYVLGYVDSFMIDFKIDDYMNGRKIGFDREALETIYRYVGQDQPNNKNKSIFYEFKDNVARITRDNKTTIDIKQDCKESTVNYLISHSEWEAIKNDMDSSKMKEAVDKLVEAMHNRIVWYEYQEGTVSFKKGEYSNVLWKKYFQAEIDSIIIEPKEDKELWTEMKYLRQFVGQHNKSSSSDDAILIDNYFRRLLNFCGIKNDNQPYGYRTQMGHLETIDVDESSEFVAKFIFKENASKYSSNSISKNCDEFKNFELAENTIINLLYSDPTNKKQDIRGIVKKWLNGNK